MGTETDWESNDGKKVSLTDMNKWVEEVEYATIAARDAASTSYGSAELFKQCRVVESGARYYWNGGAWVQFPSTGGSGAPIGASYVTINAEAGLSGETQHKNIGVGNLHDPKTHAATHQTAGADEVDVTDLRGKLMDEQNAGWLKGKLVDALAAGDDLKFAQYNHGASKVQWAAAGAGLGDMTKAAYDTTATNSKVDTALNAEKLNGQAAAFYAVAGHKDDHKTGGSDAFLLADLLDAVARIQIKKNGVLVGTRRAANLIEGAGTTLTVTDDAGNEEVDVNIAVSGGAAHGHYSFLIYYSAPDYYAEDWEGNIVYGGAADAGAGAFSGGVLPRRVPLCQRGRSGSDRRRCTDH